MAGWMVGISLAMARATLSARGAQTSLTPTDHFCWLKSAGYCLNLLKREFIRRHKNSGDNRKKIIVQKKFIKTVRR